MIRQKNSLCVCEFSSQRYVDKNTLFSGEYKFISVLPTFHCATSRKVAGSIPDGVTGIFLWHNPSGRIMALGLTQPLTEMSTRNISWGVKAAGAKSWQPYHLHVPTVLKSGSLNFLEPYGPVQACYGIVLLPTLRPRRRWEDITKMDLQEVWCGFRDWIELALDRDRWLAYVKAAMNLRVPKNAENFLTCWKSVSFSERTLLHGVSKYFLHLLCGLGEIRYKKATYNDVKQRSVLCTSAQGGRNFLLGIIQNVLKAWKVRPSLFGSQEHLCISSRGVTFSFWLPVSSVGFKNLWLFVRTALFCVVTQRVVISSYRRFRTSYRSHPQGSWIPEPWGLGQ
jgi:hypothetical protein